MHAGFSGELSNGLSRALRKLGRIERTLLLIDWLLDPALRQRVTAALSKGEARNTLARAVCFNQLDKLHDPRTNCSAIAPVA
ncbi:Tn3 family transposase [Mycetohabitans sp. B2]|nr:Tn3 family transposase [Mycetohabitans sp. B2]